jgi:hypothetical protein
MKFIIFRRSIMGRKRKSHTPKNTTNTATNSSQPSKGRLKKLKLSEKMMERYEETCQIENSEVYTKLQGTTTKLKDKIDDRIKFKQAKRQLAKTTGYIEILSTLQNYNESTIKEILELPAKLIGSLNQTLNGSAFRRITSTSDVYEFISNVYYYNKALDEMDENPDGKKINSRKDPMGDTIFDPVRNEIIGAAEAIMSLVEIADEMDYMRPERYYNIFNPNTTREDPLILKDSQIHNLLINDNQNGDSDVILLVTLRRNDEVKELLQEFETTIEENSKAKDQYKLTVKTLQTIRDQLIEKMKPLIFSITTIFE